MKAKAADPDQVDDTSVGSAGEPVSNGRIADDPIADDSIADDSIADDPVGQTWSWYLVRVSGLFLAILLPLHFAVVVVRDDIGRTSLSTVTDRFADQRWQALEWITIALALAHSFLALRRILAHSTMRAAMRDGAVVAVGVVFLLLGVGATWAMLGLS